MVKYEGGKYANPSFLRHWKPSYKSELNCPIEQSHNRQNS